MDQFISNKNKMESKIPEVKRKKSLVNISVEKNELFAKVYNEKQNSGNRYRFSSSPAEFLKKNNQIKKPDQSWEKLQSTIQISNKFHLKVASTNTTESRKKMDTLVPSPNLMNTPFGASPLSMSIYDQEKSNTFWGTSSSKARNLEMCNLNTTEECGDLLDNNFEDSSLKSFMIPDLFNSVSTSSIVTSVYPWESKSNQMEQDPSTESSFNPLNIDSDFLMPDILNVDSNDSKFSSLVNFDFDFKAFQSNPSSSCHTPIPTESKPDSSEVAIIKDDFAPVTKDFPSKENIGIEFLHKKNQIKPNFPPRTSQPPIGVVSPVKIPEDNTGFAHHEMMDLKSHGLKDNVINASGISSSDFMDLPPQTVPSFGVANQDVYSLKTEIASPEPLGQKSPLKRSADNLWEDALHSMQDDSSFMKSKRKRCDSGSSGHMSEDVDDDYHDYNMDDDSDDDNSDLDADLAHMKPGGCESLIGVGKKQKQYFWQYNVQAKGPKGTRLKLAVGSPSDPHVLNGFEDPVFDEGNTMLAGIRHGGKARKGDGNEVTPNPHKLFKIGHQLLRLNKKINACQLGSDVPLAKRNESRKEKNKLASRACRLKKKAQHEANKIKLHGLETEHGQINNVLRLIWPELRERVKYVQNQQLKDGKSKSDVNLTSKLSEYISSNLRSMVGGNTTDYVNNVILAVEKGDLSGGLKVKSRKS